MKKKQPETCPYIRGATSWSLYDFGCERRFNKYQNGYNLKGIIDKDRKTGKRAFNAVTEYYRTIGQEDLL